MVESEHRILLAAVPLRGPLAAWQLPRSVYFYVPASQVAGAQSFQLELQHHRRPSFSYVHSWQIGPDSKPYLDGDFVEMAQGGSKESFLAVLMSKMGCSFPLGWLTYVPPSLAQNLDVGDKYCENFRLEKRSRRGYSAWHKGFGILDSENSGTAGSYRCTCLDTEPKRLRRMPSDLVEDFDGRTSCKCLGYSFEDDFVNEGGLADAALSRKV